MLHELTVGSFNAIAFYLNIAGKWIVPGARYKAKGYSDMLAKEGL